MLTLGALEANWRSSLGVRPRHLTNRNTHYKLEPVEVNFGGEAVDHGQHNRNKRLYHNSYCFLNEKLGGKIITKNRVWLAKK